MNTLRPFALVASLVSLTACGVGEVVATEDMGVDEVADFEASLTQNGRFESFTGRDGRYYFHLLAGNGEKVLASEGYSTEAAAREGMASVKANGQSEGRYLQREAQDGSAYFVLTSANGTIIAVSEMYAAKANATRAVSTVIAILKNDAVQAPAPTTGSRFQVFRGLDSKYYFHLRAANGEIILQSQGYTTRTSANNAVTSVQNIGGDAARYQVRPAADGRYYFVLRATNGRTMAWGETYAVKAGAETAVAHCQELLGEGSR